MNPKVLLFPRRVWGRLLSWGFLLSLLYLLLLFVICRVADAMAAPPPAHAYIWWSPSLDICVWGLRFSPLVPLLGWVAALFFPGREPLKALDYIALALSLLLILAWCTYVFFSLLA